MGVCLWVFCGLGGVFACGSPDPRTPALTILRIGVGLGASGRPEALAVIAELLYAEPLLWTGVDGRPIPRLADSWEWTDKWTLRLHLRAGVKFHDGAPLTADLVTELLRSAVQRAQARSTTGGFAHVLTIETLDESSLVVRLSTPDSFLIGELAGLVIVSPANRNIGTGAFRIATQNADSIEVERNVDYYGGVPAIHRVRIVTYDTQRAAWTALMRGDVDMVQEVAREAVEFVKNAVDVQSYSALRQFYIPLVFNINHPILKRLEVRRALVEAINRQEILEKAMRGHGRIAEDPIWPSYWAYRPAPARYTYDPQSARRRLDDAGLPIRVEPTSGRMAGRFRLNCLYWGEDPQFERIALFLQRQLSEIGVDLDLEPADLQTIGKRAPTNNFDTYLPPINGGRTLNITYRWWHSPSPRGGGVQNTGYTAADDVLDRLRSSQSDVTTQSALAELRHRFYEDPPAVFLVWTEVTRAVRSDIDVGERDPDAFAYIWRWRPRDRLRAGT